MDWRRLENLAWTGPVKGAEDLGSIGSTAWTEPVKGAEDLGSIGSTVDCDELRVSRDRVPRKKAWMSFSAL